MIVVQRESLVIHSFENVLPTLLSIVFASLT